jgi:hypothetical protein
MVSDAVAFWAWATPAGRLSAQARTSRMGRIEKITS